MVKVRQKSNSGQYEYAEIFVLRSLVKSCQFCINKSKVPQNQIMSNLAPFRLESNILALTNTVVDSFGPLIKRGGGGDKRHEKIWGVIFNCLSSRAIHLGIASSLSTDSTIMAI